MSTSKQRDGAKERFWRRVLRQWRKSGLSVRAYCSQEGLSEASFYAWRRTLSRRDAQRVGFVPLAVVPAAQESSSEGSNGGVELVLAGGRLLRVRPGFDAATLQRVLALLAEGQP